MSDYRFTARFDGDDEPLLITATPRDQLAWEAQSNDRAIGTVAVGWATGSQRVTDMYTLAHAAAKRQGLYAGSLDEWKRDVEIMAGHHPRIVDEPEPEPETKVDPEAEAAKSEADHSGQVPTQPAP